MSNICAGIHRGQMEVPTITFNVGDGAFIIPLFQDNDAVSVFENNTDYFATIG
jgi:hypothetical protein